MLQRILAISSKNNFSVIWFGNFQQQLHSLLRAKQEADKFRRWTWFLFSHGNIEWIRSWHLKLPFFHMYSSTQQGRMLFTCFLYWKYFGLGDGSACMKHAGGRHPPTNCEFILHLFCSYIRAIKKLHKGAGRLKVISIWLFAFSHVRLLGLEKHMCENSYPLLLLVYIWIIH